MEKQVGDLHFWMLSHAYCSVMLPKVKFAVELAEEWHNEEDDLKRRCAYLLLYQIAKDNKKLPDSFFEPYLSLIESNIQQEENFVKDAMNTALLMIGQRSAALHARALGIAKKIGKIEVDYGDNSCQAADCVMHLGSDRVKKKVGLDV
ncbi:DNA alkylation repair protein [Flammeovirgaceae bacterium SG7u.111]|nr:DNA alkylation repair protein [Flammeovirgaceae bacterium SG7u.132]WPO37487.1 DNA alkylation repair protein [Flammeovirgaceae bacterium SG7u.111]